MMSRRLVLVQMPLTRDDSYQIYEYACHEGNVIHMESSFSGEGAAVKDK